MLINSCNYLQRTSAPLEATVPIGITSVQVRIEYSYRVIGIQFGEAVDHVSADVWVGILCGKLEAQGSAQAREHSLVALTLPGSGL